MLDNSRNANNRWDSIDEVNRHDKRRHTWVFQFEDSLGFDSYRPFDEFFAHQAELYELTKVLGIRDEQLLEDFLELGFNPRTAPAVELVPIAFVAWASSSVTDEECAAAVGEVYDSQLREFPRTLSVVQNWLDTPPQPALWDLWVRYTHCRLQNMTIEESAGLLKKLLKQSRRVARASGGWLGFGAICASEQLVIDAIADVFAGASPKVQLFGSAVDADSTGEKGAVNSGSPK